MRLKRVQIKGFKSFADPTTLELDEDIVVIAGPNGTGKSNLVEAIKWVTGEQSAKQLRGEIITDLIFAGASKRPPVSYAEVSLTLLNTNSIKVAPLYDTPKEVVITRRIFSDGTSQYEINNKEVRLRDITEFFLTIGVGAKTYSIIEQGRVSSIIMSQPEELRTFIEDAAGISKFKKKKRESLEKLEETTQNLIRINDLLYEIEGNISSLKRQAQKAKRYLNYKEELKSISLKIAVHKWLELEANLKYLSFNYVVLKEKENSIIKEKEAEEEVIKELRRKIDEYKSELHTIQSELYFKENRFFINLEQFKKEKGELAQLKGELRSVDGSILQLTQSLMENRGILAKYEDRLSILKEKLKENETEKTRLEESLVEIEESLSKKQEELQKKSREIFEVEKELMTIQNRFSFILKEKERLEEEKETIIKELEKLITGKAVINNRLDTLSKEEVELKENSRNINEELSKLNIKLSGLKERIKNIEEELNYSVIKKKALEEKKKTLLQIKESFSGYDKGVKELLTSSPQYVRDMIKGILADFISYPQQFEEAVLVALGDKLQYLVLKSRDLFPKFLEYIDSKGDSIGSTLGIILPPEEEIKSREDREKECVRIGGRELLRLSSVIKVDDFICPIVNRWIENYFIVSDKREALEIIEKTEGALSLVTLAGELFESKNSFRRFSRNSGTYLILSTRRNLKKIDEELEEVSSKVSILENELKRVKEYFLQLERERENYSNSCRQLELKLLSIEKDKEGLRKNEESLKSRIDKLELKINTLELKLKELEVEFKEIEVRKRKVEDKLSSLKENYNSLNKGYREILDNKERLKKEYLAVLESVKENKTEMEAIERKVQALRDKEGEETKAFYSLQLKREAVIKGLGKAMGFLLKSKEKMDQIEITLKNLKREEAKLNNIISNLELNLKEKEISLYQLEKREKEIGSEINRVLLEIEKIKLNKNNIEEEIRYMFNEELRFLVSQFHDQKVVSREEIERKEEIERVLEGFGRVNLEAPQQYEEALERYNKLRLQKEDLEASIKNLKKAIDKLDSECKEKFREAFEEIDRNFQQLIPILFGGGGGKLLAIDPEDLLNTGINIEVSLPGKRLKKLQLLSGGEKALSAIGFLFAIILYSSPPFCIMDEVDAHLDEVNINRFGELIERFSSKTQFIIITHSVETMKKAKLIYGITMPEPGVSKVYSISLKEREQLIA